MTELTWDDVGERRYETGVDHGVLYIPNVSGVYDNGVAWNGLTTVTEKPSGADSNAQFADNIKYLNLLSAEDFGATLEAFTYPDEFAQFDGLQQPSPGVAIGQQTRKSFGLCYRTKIGNDIEGDSLGFKLHLIYGAQASPSEKAYSTVNDSPAPITFSWEITTTPAQVTDYKPTALIVVDSTVVGSDDLDNLMALLYGTVGTSPSLPTPDEVLALFSGSVSVLTGDIVTAPTYNASTDTITIPAVTGVTYYIDGEVVSGGVVITEDTVVTATANAGYVFGPTAVNEWFINFS